MNLAPDAGVGPAAADPRLDTEHARRRLAIEAKYETRAASGQFDIFHGPNWYSMHSAIRAALKLSGYYRRGQDNAGQVRVRENRLRLAALPAAFDGYTILQVSDLHVEFHPGAMRRAIEIVGDLDYDVAVLTGDYRARTYGPIEPSLEGVAALKARLRGPVWGVLGNHDSIRMLPALEAMGIRMLVNEWTSLARGDARISMAGVDDANYFAGADFAKATSGMPRDGFSILLTHTPEIYREAAAAGFDLLLAGHTHGGQICLPGGWPPLVAARMPRRYGSGAWRYGTMQGYTTTGVGCSGVDVRFNCPPEVTLHRLERA